MKRIVDDLTKKLVDEGKLIEAGWVGLMFACDLQSASDIQKREMRKAFFAGAQHLFGSLMSFLEEGREETENDMRRMSQVHEELQSFIKEFKEQTFV
jgi:hypothetical protein